MKNLTTEVEAICKNLVGKFTFKFNVPQYRQDLLQEARIAAFVALRDFDQKYADRSDVSPQAVAYFAVCRALNWQNQKELIREVNFDNFSVGDLAKAFLPSKQNVETEAELMLFYRRTVPKLKKRLNKRQFDMYIDTLAEKNQIEVSKELGITRARVGQLVQSARKVAKKILTKERK